MTSIRTIPQRPAKAIRELRAACPEMARAIDAVGSFRLETEPPTLHALCGAIIGQQLSIVVAARILERFTALAGTREKLAPRHIDALSDEQLRGVGLSGAKLIAVRGLADFWRKNKLSTHCFDEMADEDVLALLTQVKGIGPWTAKMFLIFSLRRADVLAHEDFGLRAGLKKLHRLEEIPARPQVEEMAARWAPWRSVATWYCWQYLKVPEE